MLTTEFPFLGSFEEDYKRVYPYNSLACRVLGYTSSGNVGNWGIEEIMLIRFSEDFKGVCYHENYR